ncbi:MAG: methyl-accepting chemotaxis protein [Treponema sp.]|jgi:methyl-accepting chemotaxis protein|nr:methyl-accepting chemotaxis protein [Treponema sp.]
MKLSRRISINVGILVLTVSLGIGLISVFVSLDIIEKNADASLVHQAESGADLIRTSIRAQLDILLELANKPEVRSAVLEEQLNSLDADVQRTGYLDIAIVGRDGIAHYVKDKTTSKLGDRDYVIKALAGEPAISDVIISRVLGKPVVMNAVPVRDMNGNVFCALIGRRDGSALNEITKNVKLGKTGYSYMTNKNGIVVSHKNTDYVLNQFNPLEEAKNTPALASWADAVAKAMGGGSGFLIYTLDNEKKAAGFITLDDFPWILYVTISWNELMTGIKTMIFTIMISAVGFIIVGIFVASLIGRNISIPIIKIADTLKEISEGAGNLTKSIMVKSKDEVGDLALYFNLTLGKIKELVIVIKNQSILLNNVGNDMSSSMTDATSSIREITSNINDMGGQVENQSSSVTKTDAAMDQIISYIRELNNLIEQQAVGVNQSSAAIEELLSSIKSVTNTLVINKHSITELADASDLGRASLQTVEQDIQEISRESEGLLEINSVMQTISSQTNLLSMNAAIEAAHAGEAGRGFAVVADEIRKLAESSGQQSKTISGMLKKIKDSIDRITKSTDEVLRRFVIIDGGVKTVLSQEQNILNAVEKQSAESNQILESVSHMKELTGMVKDNSNEMYEGSGEVMKESKKLAAISAEISDAMIKMAAGAGKINKSAEQVNLMSVKTKELITVLVEAVSHFKVE